MKYIWQLAIFYLKKRRNPLFNGNYLRNVRKRRTFLLLFKKKILKHLYL
nr:MAG TPA: hypothetical protein [Caudoviricetes sp.]